MFKIYSSSAGSGKTYTLTREYLRLALHPTNDGYYRHILAVTFTNAAAGEMKERILGMLFLFSGDAAKAEAHPMLQELAALLYPGSASDPGMLKEAMGKLRKRADQVFRRILHGYSDFSVMTIDSFMSRLVASFTDELGLPFGFETRLDADLLTDAVDRLLARIGREGDEALTRIIENYYSDHTREGKGWGSLPESIRKTAHDLLGEQSYLALSRVSHLQLEDWMAIRRQLLAFTKAADDEMSALAARAFELISSASLQASDFYQGNRGIYGYFESRAGREKLWEAPNSYALNTVRENQWAGGKTGGAVKSRIDAVSEVLSACFEEMEQLRQTLGPRVCLYRMLAGQLYNLSLLREIKSELDTLLRQHNQVHISEFNRRVIDIVSNDPVPFIFERLGEKYNHILIDEFQDTSKLQFANLLPLIDNALAGGHFSLIVGDVKQAIYRFRGGDMDLLLKLSQGQASALSALLGDRNTFMEDRLWQLGQSSQLTRLTANRRSYREIIQFNNDFFGFLSRVLGSLNPAVTEVYDAYFGQETVETTPSGGHIRIDFFDQEDETGDETDETSETVQPDAQGLRIITLLEQLRGDGYQWRDIALLCREKKQARQLALWLEAIRIPLISDDSLLLSNSSQIRLLTGFIRVLYTPANRTHRLETALLFHRITGGGIPDGEAFENMVTMSLRDDLLSFTDYFRPLGAILDGYLLQQLGIYELCEQLIGRLGLFALQTENEYLFRFLDEALRFSTSRTSHPGDFLNWWDTSGENISIGVPSDADAVRITTIHKSKGLEYPVVLLPYAQWSTAPKAQSRLWVDLDNLDYAELVPERAREARLASASVPLKKELKETLLGEVYEEETNRVLLENLNLLYVAFTRPVQRLYVLAAFPSPPDPGRGNAAINQWLRAFLEERNEWQETQRTYLLTQGEAGHTEPGAPAGDRPFVIASPAVNTKAASYSLKRNADRFFDTETFEKKHDIYQKLKYVMTTLRSPAALPRLLRKLEHEGILTRAEAPRVEQLARNLLKIPVLAPVYMPELATSLPHELLLPGGRIVEADRVVLIGNRCTVLHYCTGPDKITAAHTLERQLEIYRAAGFDEVGGILVDLAEGRAAYL